MANSAASVAIDTMEKVIKSMTPELAISQEYAHPGHADALRTTKPFQLPEKRFRSMTPRTCSALKLAATQKYIVPV
jgi:hypothetical protein